ncbi:MAG: CPBP family intramembrane metalloprotease [Caulobacteraceae bacterium]|nr:CPBP family intramembrane metalloprotease [Caulobacteraceae bacterium]
MLLALGATIGAGALVGADGWFGLGALGVMAQLKQQIVTALVYLALAGAIMSAFRPVSLPPLALRGAESRYFLLAPVVLALTLAASGLVYATVSSWTGGAASASRQVLSVATDVKWIGPHAPPSVWIIATLRGTLLAPLFEELLFRGALLSWLAGHIPVAAAALVSAALFAAMHGFPVVMPYAFLFGLAATWLRLRSGSLLPGLTMHALNSLLFLAAGLELLR